ncbi:hypothetical protein ACTRW9_02540 [Nitrospina sp. 32_T5]|uniref:hypothetical protein n=1 Tax=unclassified Nitrospina TaxID=2638683 RepID=UPI003F9DAEC4
MSKRETPITIKFWEEVIGGTLVLEYPLAEKSKTSERRAADAVIFPHLKKSTLHWKEAPTLEGHDVVVVQTKTRRLGMYLMGQTVFSGLLAKNLGAKSVRSVALCKDTDTNLAPFLKEFDFVELWVTKDEGFERII